MELEFRGGSSFGVGSRGSGILRGGGCFGLISSQMPGPAQAYGDRLRGDVHAGSARVVSGGPNYLVQSGRIAREGGEKGKGVGEGEGGTPPLPSLSPFRRPPPPLGKRQG